MANDITIFENGDGGELLLTNEDIATVDGLTNMILLAWFGGNVQESTNENLSEQEQRQDWWGNSLFKEDNQFNSSLEKTLNTASISSAGLVNIENSAKKDLEFLAKFGTIEVNASLLDGAKFEIEAIITEPNKKSLKSTFLWDATKKTVINEYTIS